LAGAALNLHPMAEGICHDALSFRASTIGRGSLLLYVCLGGRADGDYESSLEIHVRQAFAGMAALMFCAFSAATAAAMDRGQFQNVPPEIREWFENMRSPKGIGGRRLIFIDPPFPSLPAALVRRGNITHSRGVIILTATCLVPQAPVAVKLRVSTSLAELSIR
jgi:hypothetical protein